MTTGAPAGPARLLPLGLQDPSLAAHLARYGPLPAADTQQVLAQVERSGLTGRGGAGFRTHRKLAAVAAGRHPVVVANAAEGEPGSRKDQTLLRRTPHLVLDGLQLAAVAVRARRAVLYVPEGDSARLARQAVTERAAMRKPDRLPVEVVEAPAAFLSGEESAVVARINGRPALPTSKPPMVFHKGVDGRPTLVQNVETLAHLALVVRYGAAWFREVGTDAEPGTMLCTVSGTGGDVAGPPRVVETALGTPLRQVLQAADPTGGPPQALLVGGYHGAWLPPEAVDHRRLSHTDLAPLGASPGAGVLFALGGGVCPLHVSAQVMEYLASQSARQCGPCLNGLPALAAALRQLAAPSADGAARARALALADLVHGRGACHHPDGSVRFVRSVLGCFAADVDAHVTGRCLSRQSARRG